MEKLEILAVVSHNTRNSSIRKRKLISHPKNPNILYHAYQTLSMHCDDGQWRIGVVYSDGTRTYCRRADDFGKFVEVV